MIYVDGFLEHCRLNGSSDGTLRAYEQDIRLFLTAVGREDPSKVTPEEFAAWDKKLQFSRHHNTRVRRRGTVSRFYAYLHEVHGHSNITAGVKSLQTRESDPFLPYPEELEAVLHAQNEADKRQARDGALVALLACTGIRRSEAATLAMRDISLSANGKNWIVDVLSLKPRFRTRRVNFGDIERKGDVATAHFGLWFLRRIELFGSSHAAARYPVFTDLIDEATPLSSRSLQNCITSACKRAAVERLFQNDKCRLTPKSLRHYFATYCKANGMDLMVISQYLGHASTRTTERYVHLAEKATSEQMLRFGPTKGLTAKPSLDVSGLQDILRLRIPRSS